MEDDKKKKRNKKKKNKQNNKRVDDALASGATTSVDENHIGDGDVPQISGGPDADESQSSHQIDVVATEDDSGVENKSQGSEVLLEETIKQLREENGSYLQKEAGFEENVRRLETENEAHIQKEASED
jgi:transcription elongation factor S-II